MKLLLKSSRVSASRPSSRVKPAVVKAQRASAPVAADSAGVVTQNMFDKWVMYVGDRVRKSVLAGKTVGQPIPVCRHAGYLVVVGNKGGMLVHPVKWDNKDYYVRDGLYGKVSALNGASPALKAEIIDEAELIRRATKARMVREVCHALDNQNHKVALLNNWGDQYVAGITVENRKLKILNMEHPAKWNRAKVQFTHVKDLTESVTKFLSQAQ